VEKRDISLIDACRILRKQWYQGAILAVGNLQHTSQRSDFLQAGGDGFLMRPIVLTTWRHTLSMYLPDAPTPADKSASRILSEFHADRDFIPLIRSYVNKLPAHLAEMRSALQVADAARFIRLTHALIDGGQLYGYPKLADAAISLQQSALAGVDAPRLSQLLDDITQLIFGMERGIKASPSAGYLALPGTLTRAA
jgi:HPt (histidine-containing phosphotransfer) domain-containing protein